MSLYFGDGSYVSFDYLDTIGELMKDPKVKSTEVDEDGFSKEDLDRLQKIIDKLRAQYCNYEE